jgi:hypothetical protein
MNSSLSPHKKISSAFYEPRSTAAPHLTSPPPRSSHSRTTLREDEDEDEEKTKTKTNPRLSTSFAKLPPPPPPQALSVERASPSLPGSVQPASYCKISRQGRGRNEASSVKTVGWFKAGNFISRSHKPIRLCHFHTFCCYRYRDRDRYYHQIERLVASSDSTLEVATID